MFIKIKNYLLIRLANIIIATIKPPLANMARILTNGLGAQPSDTDKTLLLQSVKTNWELFVVLLN